MDIIKILKNVYKPIKIYISYKDIRRLCKYFERYVNKICSTLLGKNKSFKIYLILIIQFIFRLTSNLTS